MNNDIRPPRPQPNPSSRDATPPLPYAQPAVQESTAPQVAGATPELPAPVPASTAVKSRNRIWKWLAVCVGVVILAIAAAGVWYIQAQQPVQAGAADKRQVTIETGMTPSQIGSQLKQAGVIRSELAFSLYTRVSGARHHLQAGDYRLSPGDALPAIVDQLLQGQVNEFRITFYPGATLFDPTDVADEKRTDVYTMLRRAGYSDSEIRAALDKHYDHPLLVDKPNDASLEGYVYGDTYQFTAGTSVEDILTRTFDEFYAQITAHKLIEKLKKQSMTLHEGITLASIIEREVSGRVEDQKQVSQIFHLRLDKGISLGADATFMYAAQQQNKTPSTGFDSPYNTRKHAGLPPGPISSPHISALEAAAEPAPGDYLYFVSGDDGRTHFAHTMAEHEENTRKFCTDLCYAIE